MSELSIDIRNIAEFKNWLIHVKEKYFIELKKAQELPNAFWDTYSSFSNTSGGYVILGVEEGNPENKIIGVGNVEFEFDPTTGVSTTVKNYDFYGDGKTWLTKDQAEENNGKYLRK